MKLFYFIIALILAFCFVGFVASSPVFAGGHAAPHHTSKTANDHDADDGSN